MGQRVVGTVLLDGGVAPEPSVLLRPLVVRGVFGGQTRRLVRDSADADGCTAVAEGAAAAKRLVADAVDSLTREPHLAELATTGAPVHLVAAARGADDTEPAFLSGNAIAAGNRVVPHLTWERVEANHATVLFDPAAAAAVRELLSS